MEEDDPIARHCELQLTIVAAGSRFFCLRELRTHTRVRHVGFYRNMRARDRMARRVG